MPAGYKAGPSGSIGIIKFSSTSRFALVFALTGMSFHVPTGLRHQMIAGKNGAKIIEFSTHHEDSDSIRIIKGD